MQSQYAGACMLAIKAHNASQLLYARQPLHTITDRNCSTSAFILTCNRCLLLTMSAVLSPVSDAIRSEFLVCSVDRGMKSVHLSGR